MVSAATEAATIASISTPVRPSIVASASISTPPSTTAARTSPLGASPAATAAAVSEVIRTNARATARLRVTSLDDTSTIRAAPDSSRCVRGSGGNALRCLDQLAHAVDVVGAQQLDRVRLAVDDALEERLA